MFSVFLTIFSNRISDQVQVTCKSRVCAVRAVHVAFRLTWRNKNNWTKLATRKERVNLHSHICATWKTTKIELKKILIIQIQRKKIPKKRKTKKKYRNNNFQENGNKIKTEFCAFFFAPYHTAYTHMMDLLIRLGLASLYQFNLFSSLLFPYHFLSGDTGMTMVP